MELEAAKMIGAGLAAIALAGAGVGIGIIFGNYLSGAMRNPSAAQKQFPNLLLGFALAEATGLFGLVIALRASSKATEVCVNAAGLIIKPSKSFSTLCIKSMISLSLLLWQKINSTFNSLAFFCDNSSISLSVDFQYISVSLLPRRFRLGPFIIIIFFILT